MKPKYTDNRQRFIEVGERRTNKVLKAIRSLGHCSNRQLYDYHPKEIEKIIRAIRASLVGIEEHFRSPSSGGFSLNEPPEKSVTGSCKE